MVTWVPNEKLRSQPHAVPKVVHATRKQCTKDVAIHGNPIRGIDPNGARVHRSRAGYISGIREIVTPRNERIGNLAAQKRNCCDEAHHDENATAPRRRGPDHDKTP
jgi:hypothetical protein